MQTLFFSGATYTQPQNINTKLQLKTQPVEHSNSKWRSISKRNPLHIPDDGQTKHQTSTGVKRNLKPSKWLKSSKARIPKWKALLKSQHAYQTHRAALLRDEKHRQRRDTEEDEQTTGFSVTTVASPTTVVTTNRSFTGLVSTTKAKRVRSTVHLAPEDLKPKPKEPVIIIDDVEEFDSGTSTRDLFSKSDDGTVLDDDSPRVLPLRPVPSNPYEDEEMSVVYAEQHSEIRLMCEVDLDISSSMWYKNGQVSDKSSIYIE